MLLGIEPTPTNVDENNEADWSEIEPLLLQGLWIVGTFALCFIAYAVGPIIVTIVGGSIALGVYHFYPDWVREWIPSDITIAGAILGFLTFNIPGLFIGATMGRIVNQVGTRVFSIVNQTRTGIAQLNPLPAVQNGVSSAWNSLTNRFSSFFEETNDEEANDETEDVLFSPPPPTLNFLPPPTPPRDDPPADDDYQLNAESPFTYMF